MVFGLRGEAALADSVSLVSCYCSFLLISSLVFLLSGIICDPRLLTRVNFLACNGGIKDSSWEVFLADSRMESLVVKSRSCAIIDWARLCTKTEGF